MHRTDSILSIVTLLATLSSVLTAAGRETEGCRLSVVEPASAQTLVSGNPIPSAAENGIAPISFGLTTANDPVGCAFISSDENPDMFVSIHVGIGEAIGLKYCEFDCIASDGSPVYKEPLAVRAPWREIKNQPSKVRVYQKEDDVFLLCLEDRTLRVTRFDKESMQCEEISKAVFEGFEYQILSFDVIERTEGKLEVVCLCSDGSKYRPETFTGDTQSYYDGKEIYRGEIPYSGVFRTEFRTKDWTQTRKVERVSKDMKTILSGSSIVAIDDGKGLNGYLITNTLGAMKFIPYKEGPEKAEILHVRHSDGSVLTHSAHGAKVSLYGTSTSDLIVGGESAVYHYSYAGSASDGAPCYDRTGTVMQGNAPVYGGSLTVPNIVDWDGDGILDIVAGNSEGRLLFFKNTGSDAQPRFGLSQEVCSDGEPIVFRPGYHVVQGPLEAAWGYLCPTVFDWNDDGLPDVLFSGSSAKFEVMMNHGTETRPELSSPRTISIDNLELWGTWRVRPAVAKVAGRNVMVIMDGDNALHLYGRVDDNNVEDLGKLLLTNGQQITGHNDAGGRLGQCGRGKLQFVDWNGDGKLDLLVGCIKNSSYPHPSQGLPYQRFKKEEYGLQVLLFINAGTDEEMVFEDPVQLQFRGEDFYLGAHSNAPASCMLGDTSKGVNLVVGTESGKFYFFEHGDMTTVEMPD